MKALNAIKWAAFAGVLVLIFVIGYAAGTTSVDGMVDDAQVKQLTSCLPIQNSNELGKCMGLNIVGGGK